MNSTSIICPYCNYKLTDDDMLASDHDLFAIAPEEEEVEEPCPKCEKRFYIQGHYIPQYETKTMEEVEDEY